MPSELPRLAQLAQAGGWVLATAESCTGGAIAEALTRLPGSSQWFSHGVVCYSNQAKSHWLEVPPSLLETQGAVSEAVVKAMVQGACQTGMANLAVAVSGVAGPGGGSVKTPVGSVWLAWGNAQQQAAQAFLFKGDRQAVREASVNVAIRGLIDFMEKN